jgi:osmotically-inducible protein OsmY
MKTTALIAAIALMLGLAACDKSNDGRTVGQKVGESVDQAVASADKATKDVRESAKKGVDEAAEKTREKSAEMAKSVDDVAITAGIKAGLAKDKELSALRVNVDTKGGRVSLYGSAPNEAARERATQIASAEKGVTGVDNKLAIENH